jgi:eukaryotic-like serine/threonine-protein kinase
VNTSFGRYRLLERLGRGGMAEVFKAKSYGVEGFEKVVVIKRILPELAQSTQFVDMFIHEAKLAVRLSHANIVQVFDLGKAPGETDEPEAYYMAMEYVHGCDLATLLTRCRRQNRPIPVEMSVYVAAEVAKGLDHAHRRRDEDSRPLHVVHRDVSPQNVLLSYEGEVKVTDFGIAKARGAFEPTGLEDTRARQLQGKFGYMSPEQAAGESVDARSDLFSLGVMLYECITGVNPFTAPTTFETLRRVQACEYPPVELLRPDVPAELVPLLQTAMAKDPGERFGDSARMYEALLHFLYTHGRRFGGRNLSEFMVDFRSPEDAAPVLAPLETDAGDSATPAPSIRRRSSAPSMPRVESVPPVVNIERVAAASERKDVTALVVCLGDRDDEQSKLTAETTLGRYGAHIVEATPESVVAVFGLRDEGGRDTEIAARCALVLLRQKRRVSEFSIGIDTGRVYVAPDGQPVADERLSALLSSAQGLARAHAGACAVGTFATRHLAADFTFQAGGDTQRGTLPAGAALLRDIRSSREGQGRFVARREELRTVGEALARATRREASVLTLHGDHGMGKTRLLHEVQKRLGKLGYNVGWTYAACPPNGREVALSGIACMLQSLGNIEDGAPPERVRDLKPRLRALGLTDDESAAALGVLGLRTGPVASRTKEAVVQALIRIVSSLCDDRPNVFVWDAAHQMDALSFDVLHRVFGKLRGTRVLFLFAARSGFGHRLEGLPEHVSLELPELEPTELERLLASRLGVDRVPEDLLRFVAERAGGHPLFALEVLAGLRDAKAVTVAEGRVVSMRLLGVDLALPRTLRGLVASRVGRLGPGDRGLLHACAVLGDPIDVPVLSAMVGQDILALEKVLGSLTQNEMLARSGADQLVFRSPIVREVVADLLPSGAAKEMHAAAGAALERVVGARQAEHASRIATHWYEAGESERAARFFGKSGELRLEAGQLEAAARDLARALGLADLSNLEARTVLGWFAGLADASRLVRSVPQAEELCTRAAAHVDQSGDRAERVRVRIDAGRILGAVNLFDAARAQLSQAEYICESDAQLLRATLLAGAELAATQGDFRRQMELLERLARMTEGSEDRPAEHKLLLSLAQAHGAHGDRGLARTYFERAERIGLSDAVATCERQKVRGMLEYFARDYRAAALACERATDLAREAGLSHEVAVNLHNLGDLLVRQGDLARAYGAIQQSAVVCQELAFDRLLSHNRMFLAFLDGMRGDEEASRTIEQWIQYAEANGFRWEVVSGHWLRAKLLEARGDLPAARENYRALAEASRAAGLHMTELDANEALARLGSDSAG